MDGERPDIEGFIRVALGEHVEFDTHPLRLGGGRSAELFRFRLSTGPAPLVREDLVLRLLPSNSISMDECVIQTAVARLGYPAPAVLWSGTSGGRSYVIMKFVDGVSLFEAQGPLRSLHVVPEELATLMVALHQLDVASVRDALAAISSAAALDGRTRALADVDAGFEAVAHPARADLHDWFDEHQPTPCHQVVCHGDLHALNVLVDGGIAVLDWELAAIGEPEFDVARTMLLLCAVPIAMPRAARPIIERFGRRAAARFETAYRSVLPLRPDAVRWYEALHAARMVGLLVSHVSTGSDGGVASAWRPTMPLLAKTVSRITGVRLI